MTPIITAAPTLALPHRLHPLHHTLMIARKPYLPPQRQNPPKLLHKKSVHQTTLMVSLFRPRIRKQYRNLIKNTLAHIRQQSPHILRENPKPIPQTLAPILHTQDTTRYAIPVKLTPQNHQLLVCLQTLHHLLSRTKTYLQNRTTTQYTSPPNLFSTQNAPFISLTESWQQE